MTKIENRQTFLDRLQGHFSQEDITLIEFAYDLSKEAHRTQKRDQGERYFEHPRAGCLIILDELKLYDRDLIIVFLLHDVGEDTPIFGNRNASYDDFVATAQFRLSKLFGERVATAVIRLTKPAVDKKRFSSKEEVVEYHYREIPGDDYAIVGKMVDRLHNLRTSGSKTITEFQKSKKTLQETVNVYLPLFKKTTVSEEFSKSKAKLLTKIKKECKDLEEEVTDERLGLLKEEDDKKWNEISELCEP